MENSTEYTACEEYGHNYEAEEDDSNCRTCTDCGESYVINEDRNGGNV